MHILYVHQNFPAQFGHIARHLVKTRGWECTFVSHTPGEGVFEGIRKVPYTTASGATAQTHFCSRTFENAVWHCDGIYQALRARPEVKPDLIVGHSGFGSTLFLKELYPKTPIVNLFEYYYRPHDPESDMDFRRDLGWRVEPIKYQRSRCRNAMILLDLQACRRGYVPTDFQRSRFPAEYLPKLEVIFDGVDREIYHGYGEALRPSPGTRSRRTIAGVTVPETTRIVTYVSRGFESMRGFDIFMKSAKRIMEEYPDVKFFVVGSDRIAYGGDENYLPKGMTFRQWVMSNDTYDLSKFHFLGRLTPADLGRLLAATDLHIYLTVPFVLSWSMMDAMSCGAVVLGSATSPVMEMIEDGKNGLLADFFDVEAIAQKAVQVLKDPAAHRELGRAAERMIEERYSLEVVLPRMIALYEGAVGGA
jgi:glycosyltransferase involved in cell wall biosynthesis